MDKTAKPQLCDVDAEINRLKTQLEDAHARRQEILLASKLTGVQKQHKLNQIYALLEELELNSRLTDEPFLLELNGLVCRYDGLQWGPDSWQPSTMEC